MGTKMFLVNAKKFRKFLSIYFIFLLLLMLSYGVYASGLSIEIDPALPAYTNLNYVNISVSVTSDNTSSSFINWNQSLVGYWNFEHSNTANITDNSTYWSNASFNGRTVDNITGYGKFGNAFYFNGSSNQYLDCGNNNSLNITDGITVEAWIKEYETSFNKTFRNSSDDYYAYSVQQTNDGGYIVAGEKWILSTSEYDVWLMKTDSNGNMEWNKSFDWGGNDSAYSVQQTNDGGYILTGYIEDVGTNKINLTLIKTNHRGDELWNKKFGKKTHDDSGNSVIQTNEGGYAVIGYTQSYNESGNEDVWLVKTDENGDETWNKTYGGTWSDRGHSVIQTRNDSGYTGYTIVGYTWSSNGGESQDLYCIKTDSNGWAPDSDDGVVYANNTFNISYGKTTLDDCGWSVQQTTDDGYIITGYTESYNQSGGSDLWLIKANSTGYIYNQSGFDAETNTFNYTFGGRYDDYGLSVNQTNDGGYIVAGLYGASDSPYDTDLWLIKTNSTGYAPSYEGYSYQSTITFNHTFEGSETWWSAATQTTDGGYIATGSTQSFGTHGSYDFWLVKTDDYGNVTSSNNNQSLVKTIIGKGEDAYEIQLYNGTISGWINNTNVTTNLSLLSLSQDWHHIVLTCNTSKMSLYINGSLENSASINAFNSVNTQNLIIGKNFSGIIDEVRVWNRTLTPREINASYSCSGTYYHNFTGLSEGNYSYYAYVLDAEGNENDTGQQNIIVAIPHPPDDFTATATSTSSISLEWTKGSKASTTHIRRKTGGCPVSISDGTEVYNGTGTSVTDSGRSSGTTYYYSAWSWNGTGHYWSLSKATASATTDSASSAPETTNHAPAADAGGPYTGFVNVSLTFDGTDSTDEDGDTLTYSWNFGDGNTGTGASPAHTYTSADVYTVTLTVSDGSLTDTSTTTATITIIEPEEDNPPTITNTYHIPTNVTSEDKVTIYATATDDYGISSIVLYYNADSGEQSKNMTQQNNDDDIYSAVIGPFKGGITVTYKVKATDTAAQTEQSDDEFTVQAKVTNEVGNISSGEKQEIPSNQLEGTGLDGVKLTSKTDLKDVKIVITKLKDDPENIIKPMVEDLSDNETKIKEVYVYSYLEINLTAENQTVADENMDINITFKVTKEWLEKNNISYETVTLMRYHNGEWQKLSTTRLNESDIYVYYTATTTGTSTFAVVGGKIETIKTESKDPGLPWMIIAGVIISGLIVLMIILFKARYIYFEKK